MDRQELKRILRDQVQPFDHCVQQKIKYLQGNDVFDSDYSELSSSIDISLEEAFDESLLSAKKITYEDPLSGAYTSYPSNENIYSRSSDNNQKLTEKRTSQQSIIEHKKSMAEKIAALRGISVPTAYLDKKV